MKKVKMSIETLHKLFQLVNDDEKVWNFIGELDKKELNSVLSANGMTKSWVKKSWNKFKRLIKENKSLNSEANNAKARRLVYILGIEKWDKQCEEVGTVIPLKTARYSCGTCGTALSKVDFEADMCPTCENLSI